MAKVLPHVLDPRLADRLHGDRMLEHVGMAQMFRQPGQASVASHQAKELHQRDRKQTFTPAGAVMMCSVSFEPALYCPLLVQEIVWVFDQRLNRAAGSLEALYVEKAIREIRGRELHSFAGAQTVPEAHQEQHPIPLPICFGLREQPDKLLSAKVLHGA